MDARCGSPDPGFDSRGFWQEANAILAQGTREMLLSARNKDSLISAYDRMDEGLGELVSRMNPPEKAREELNFKLNDRICMVGRIMKASNIDAESYWSADMKRTAMIVLKALGKSRNRVFRIDRLVEDAGEALSEGNFTRDGARRLIAELSAYECKDLRGLLSNLNDSPTHMEFLRTLSEKGTPKARRAARAMMEGMLPEAEKPKPVARVIPIAMAAALRSQLRRA